jgi:hypothetical protein
VGLFGPAAVPAKDAAKRDSAPWDRLVTATAVSAMVVYERQPYTIDYNGIIGHLDRIAATPCKRLLKTFVVRAVSKRVNNRSLLF